jgi:cellobiose phosphorylase
MYKQVKEMQISNLPNKLTAIRQEEEYEVSQDEAFDLLYYNGLGGFTQEGDEYVIHLKEQQNTPAPWVNIISNPHFGFTVSESGSGYTWYKNSRENKITPWTNDAVSDAPGEVIYISEKETGQVWTSTPLPIREEESYTVRHGFGYSIFEHNSHGMKQRLTQFVPVDETVKISILNLKNISRKSRKLTLTYYVRPVLGVTDQTTALHVQTSATRAGTLLVENKYNVEFDDKICFVDTSINERTVTGNRHEFFGTGGMKDPEALSREHLSDTLGSGYDPCTAIQVEVMLEPNENKDIVFLLGMAKKMDVDSIANHYKSVKKSTDAFLEVKNFWKDKLTGVQVTTPIESMNLMLNGWLHYQVISSRLWGRTGFYQSGGAFGFRDQLQDVLSLAHFWPDVTRSQILLHAKHQFIEGDVQHWWHEPSGKGTRTRFSDDRLWLPYVVSEYIRISGDASILNEQVSYLESPVLSEFEDERYGNPSKSEEVGSIYEHCIKAIEISCEFGRNGLPLMGSGDWNDGMNRVGNDGFGESVWLAWFLIVTLKSFIPFCQEKGDSEKVQDYSQIMTQVTEAIEQNAWDGNWYRRAFFDDGRPLGSIKNEECKIDSLAQSWAVITGTGDLDRAKIAMSSLEEHLVQREEGLIKLLTPPFDKGPQDPGYIKGYIPGVRENGGQYTHAASWAIIAFALLGEGNKSLELFELINPINHTDNLREYSRYKVEPYVIAADVYSVYPHVGRGGWTWYTGAAGWLYRAGLEYILGFKKNGTALVIDPCIPSTWKQYKMNYTYNQGTYEITINNPDGVNKGVKKISVDGKISAGNRIDLADDQRTHIVEVFMG